MTVAVSPVVALRVVVVLFELEEPASGQRIPVANKVLTGATARMIRNATRSFRFTGHRLFDAWPVSPKHSVTSVPRTWKARI